MWIVFLPAWANLLRSRCVPLSYTIICLKIKRRKWNHKSCITQESKTHSQGTSLHTSDSQNRPPSFKQWIEKSESTPHWHMGRATVRLVHSSNFLPEWSNPNIPEKSKTKWTLTLFYLIRKTPAIFFFTGFSVWQIEALFAENITTIISNAPTMRHGNGTLTLIFSSHDICFL